MMNQDMTVSLDQILVEKKKQKPSYNFYKLQNVQHSEEMGKNRMEVVLGSFSPLSSIFQ